MWGRFDKAVLATLEVYWSSFRPVYVPGKIESVVLSRSYRPFYVPGKIDKDVFTTVEVQ